MTHLSNGNLHRKGPSQVFSHRGNSGTASELADGRTPAGGAVPTSSSIAGETFKRDLRAYAQYLSSVMKVQELRRENPHWRALG